jgi:hypothetical protein
MLKEQRLHVAGFSHVENFTEITADISEAILGNEGKMSNELQTVLQKIGI